MSFYFWSLHQFILYAPNGISHILYGGITVNLSLCILSVYPTRHAIWHVAASLRGVSDNLQSRAEQIVVARGYLPCEEKFCIKEKSSDLLSQNFSGDPYGRRSRSAAGGGCS